MTRDELTTAMQGIRFNTYTAGATLTRLQQWLSEAEIAVWNAADWQFKRVPAADLAVTAGSFTPTMPADFGKAKRVYDANGDRLEYLIPDEWEANYAVGNIASGAPEAYTVINRQIYLGPRPQSSATFKLAHRRRYSHRADGTTPTAGFMNSALDTPLWDVEHHYVLVPWAIILGAKLEGDPTAEELRVERDGLLKTMIDEHVGDVEGEPTFWGVAC